MSLAALPADKDTTCHLFDTCTGVRCCSDVDVISRSLNTYLTIDTCSQRMSVGVEKFSVNVSLVGYQYGTKERVNLHGVVRLE